jgi:hypothetical protein
MTGYINPDGSALGGGLLPTNLGQALSLDASGNLKVISENVAGMPVITEDAIRAYIAAGQSFNATTGKVAVVGASSAVSFFSPASNTKNVLLYSILIAYSSTNGIMHDVRLANADPNYPNPLSLINMKQASGAPGSVVNATYATTTITASGSNLLSAPVTGQNLSAQVFENGAALLFPAGTANGVIAFLGNGTTGTFSVTFCWIEF